MFYQLTPKRNPQERKRPRPALQRRAAKRKRLPCPPLSALSIKEKTKSSK